MNTIRDIEVFGKRILIREDLNVPMDANGEITSDSRIMSAVPTIKYLLERGAKVIIMSHLGRPKKNEDEFKLDPVARRLSELLKKPVKKMDQLTGKNIEEAVAGMQNGEVIMLENVRFDPRETKNDPSLSRELALLGDYFVNDAFSASHREHCSVCGVADFLPVFAGFQMEKEIQELNKVLEHPVHPFILLQGGAKVSTKIGILEKLLPKIDKVCIGGGMAFTFPKAMGYCVGKSIVEEDNIGIAKEILIKAKEMGKEIMLPVDFIITDSIEKSTVRQVVSIDRFPNDMIGADIGPNTVENFKRVLIYGKTILANGPMGVFEMPGFKTGTLDLYRFLGDIRDAYEIAAGGDTSAAIEQFGLTNKFTYISSGGGATLEFLEGIVLPGIAKLNA
jgi:phosphoglycerate kinase